MSEKKNSHGKVLTWRGEITWRAAKCA
jgi:hypothetical protein